MKITWQFITSKNYLDVCNMYKYEVNDFQDTQKCGTYF